MIPKLSRRAWIRAVLYSGMAITGGTGYLSSKRLERVHVNIQLRGDRLVRLVISGHTHGGQIRVPCINWAPWVPCSMKYRGSSGLIKETRRRWTFITKGIGTFFVPIRLACPPDVAILRLRRTQ